MAMMFMSAALCELIGLEGVKEEINSLANFVKVQKMRSEKGLKTRETLMTVIDTRSLGCDDPVVALD